MIIFSFFFLYLFACLFLLVWPFPGVVALPLLAIPFFVHLNISVVNLCMPVLEHWFYPLFPGWLLVFALWVEFLMGDWYLLVLWSV